MNLGHLLFSVCSSGNFTVTQAVWLLCTKLSIFYESRFVLQIVGKVSHTHWLPSWHYGTVTFCWLGAAVSHVFTIWAPRHYWLSALSPQADWGKQRVDSRYAAATGVWPSVSGHHHWHRPMVSTSCRGLVSMTIMGCSQGGIQPKQFAVNQRRESSNCPTEKATLNSCLVS